MKKKLIIFATILFFIGCESKEIKQQLTECQQELKELQEYVHTKETYEELLGIAKSLEIYYMNCDTYPDSFIELHHPGYEPFPLFDRWRNEIVYMPDEQLKSYRLISKGCDGKIDTDDDIIIEEKECTERTIKTGTYKFK